MSVYPIRIYKFSGRQDSSSGGKDYHMLRAETAEGRALIVFRWGKKDQWGTGFDAQRTENIAEARRLWNLKHREKFERGGYGDNIIIKSEKAANDEKELRAALGMYWGKLGPENLKHLDPAIDGGDSKAQENVEWQKSGVGYERVEKPKLVEEHKETVEERAAENPLFGLF